MIRSDVTHWQKHTMSDSVVIFTAKHNPIGSMMHKIHARGSCLCAGGA